MRSLGGLALAILLLSGCGDDEGDQMADPGPTSTTPVVTADDLPVAHTPEGGYGDHVPEPVLGTCTEPLVDGAPDLRGLWRVVVVEVGGTAVDTHPAMRHVERIEQCGDRLVVTGGGVVHDMRCDGTEAGGVHDVAQADFRTPVTVVAAYEDGVHVLRPVGLDVEVTRRIEGDRMVWSYIGFTAHLDRIGGPTDPFPEEA